MIELGSRVKCRYTGFDGIAIARSEYLNGCTRVGVQPEKLDKDGVKVAEVEWFDEVQLITVKPRVHPTYIQQPVVPVGQPVVPVGRRVGTGGPARESVSRSRDPR